MFVRTSYLYNFRNLSAERLEWSPGFNLISGPNGAGKTNFLEALSMIFGWGMLDSSSKLSNAIRWGAASASLWASVSGEEDAEIFLSVGERSKCRIGGKPASSSRLRATVPMLAFLTDSISLVRGGALHRRRLIDIVCALVISGYSKNISSYRRVLRQKSLLLRRGADARPADRVMAQLGGWIWAARERAVEMIASSLRGFSSLLPRSVEVIFVRGGGGASADAREDMTISLGRHSQRERAARVALVGPHRDDMALSFDGRSAGESLSRGQSRRAAAALVMASADAVERGTGRRPVIVFDEMTNDLDGDGVADTFDALLSTGCQIFASSTSEICRSDISVRSLKGGRFA